MAVDLTGGKTSVFWDVGDFPVPEGRRIREIVETVLRKKGYNREVSITVYGETNPFSAEEIAEGGFTFVERRDKYWRLHKMLVDIGFWALDKRHESYRLPSNLMVVAKNIEEDTEFVRLVQYLINSGFNVFLVLPDGCTREEAKAPYVHLAWYWKSLLEVAEPMSPTELDGLLDRSKQLIVNKSEDLCDMCQIDKLADAGLDRQ